MVHRAPWRVIIVATVVTMRMVLTQQLLAVVAGHNVSQSGHRHMPGIHVLDQRVIAHRGFSGYSHRITDILHLAQVFIWCGSTLPPVLIRRKNMMSDHLDQSCLHLPNIFCSPLMHGRRVPDSSRSQQPAVRRSPLSKKAYELPSRALSSLPPWPLAGPVVPSLLCAARP